MENLIISGYALHWNEKAFIDEGLNGQYYEQFERGAFAKSLKTEKQKFLLYHKEYYEIDVEHLIFMEDDSGLAFRIELKNNSDGRTFYSFVRDGTTNHVSVSFRNAKGKVKEYQGFPHRIIHSADLVEISLVTFPAYKSSSVRIGCPNMKLNMLSQIKKSLSLGSKFNA